MHPGAGTGADIALSATCGAAGNAAPGRPRAGVQREVDPRDLRSTLAAGAIMAKDDIGLIEPDEIAYRLELTPPELKVTYSALKTLLNDFGHDEYDVQRIIRSVLNKLPPREAIESIDLALPHRRRRL
jgi:hypothetical protein